MLPYTRAVNETCRADLGRWQIRENPFRYPSATLCVANVTPGGAEPRVLAVVVPTSDLRLTDEGNGYEDETARANASLIADAPVLLAALAELLDAVRMFRTKHLGRHAELERCVARAESVLSRQAVVSGATNWWNEARECDAVEMTKRVNQLENAEGV
jgi:hypothetical protein